MTKKNKAQNFKVVREEALMRNVMNTDAGAKFMQWLLLEQLHTFTVVPAASHNADWNNSLGALGQKLIQLVLAACPAKAVLFHKDAYVAELAASNPREGIEEEGEDE